MSRMGSLMPPVWCAMFFVYETSAIMVWKEKIAADRKLLRSLFFWKYLSKNAKLGFKIQILG